MRKSQRCFGPKRVAIMALSRWPYSIGIAGQVLSDQLADIIGMRTQRFKILDQVQTEWVNVTPFQFKIRQHHPSA